MAAAAACSAAATAPVAPFQMSSSFKRNSKRAHNIITTAVVTGGPAPLATTTSTHLAPPSLNAKGLSRSPSGSGKSVTFRTEDDGSVSGGGSNNTKCRNNNKQQSQQQIPNNNTKRNSMVEITPNSKKVSISVGSGVGAENGCNNATNNGDVIPMTTLGDNASSRPASVHSPTTGISESPFGIAVTNDGKQIESQK